MSIWKRTRTDLLLIFSLLLLPLLLYGSVTLGGQTMLPLDNLYQWEPWLSSAAELGIGPPQNQLISDLVVQNVVWKQFIRQSLANGELPLWNPHAFAGAPFLAAGQHFAYYPFSILFLILPLTAAYGWFTLLHLWLAGVTMYGYGRFLRLSPFAAAIAGLTFQGAGFLLTSAAVFPMIIAAAVWLPLLLTCIGQIVQGVKNGRSPFLWFVVGTISLGCHILAGHIEYTIYTLLVMAAYAAWLLASHSRHSPIQDSNGIAQSKPPFVPFVVKSSGWLLSFVLLGLMLGGIQLLPLYELGQLNFREESAAFDQVLDWGFPKRRMLTLALPNFFGNPSHHTTHDWLTGEEIRFTVNANGEPKTDSEWGLKNYVEGGFYLGILPLFLALIGLLSGWKRHRSETIFHTLLALLSLGFIFGTPLYGLLYYGLPFINQLHTPFRWTFPFSLAVATLVGLGANSFFNAETQRSKGGHWRALAHRAPLVLGILAAVCGIGLLIGLVGTRLAFEQLQPLAERLLFGLANATAAFANARTFWSYLSWQMLRLGGLLVGTAVFLLLTHFRQKFGSIRENSLLLFLFAFTLITTDLYLANRNFHAANDPLLFDHQPALVSWLAEQQAASPEPFRITSYAPDGSRPLNANNGWRFGLQDIRGYDSIIHKQYTDYMAVIEPQGELKFNRVQPIRSWEALNSPLLDVLTIRYVIASQPIDLPKFSLAWEGEGVQIYENLGVAPRAYTLPVKATLLAANPFATLRDNDPRTTAVFHPTDLPPNHPVAQLTNQPSQLTPATILAHSNNEVTTQTAVSAPSWLILNDSHFPGWRAFVQPADGTSDEVERPIIRVNGNFRAVLLDQGEWQVRFRYSPFTFQLGGLLSGMGSIILLFTIGVWGWQRSFGDDTRQSRSRSLFRNSAAPMLLNLFNRGIDFLFAAFYLRFLGPAVAGAFQNAIVTAGIFEILANFGLNILLIRDVSQARGKASSYLLNTTILRLGTGTVASLPILAYLFIDQQGSTPIGSAEVTAVLLIMVGMVFSGMSAGVTGLFYVHERADIPSAMTTITTILKVGLGVIALLLGYGIVGLAAVSILVNLVTLTLLALLATRSFTLAGPWQIDWPLQRNILRRGYPLMLIHLLQTVFIQVDVILLRQMLPNGDTVVGWYSSAYKWFNAAQIIPSFFTLALFPIISREIEESPEQARTMYGMSLKLMLLLALPLATFTHFAATELVTIVAGEQFLPHGAVALQIVMWSIPLGWLNSVTNYVLIGLGLERLQPRAFLLAVGFNLIANWLFIPHFSYVAAAVTTVLSELVLLLLFNYFIRQKMQPINWLNLIGRPVGITAVSILAIWLGSQLHLIIGLLLGGLVYIAGLFLLRVITPDEWGVVLDILPAPLVTRFRLLQRLRGEP